MEVLFNKVSFLLLSSYYFGDARSHSCCETDGKTLPWNDGPRQHYMWLAKGARGIFRLRGSQGRI